MTYDPDEDRKRSRQARLMPEERDQSRQARLVAVVISLTMIFWMAGQWLGGEMGWEARYVFLFDMLALAAFLWAMIVTWQIWRKRRDD